MIITQKKAEELWLITTIVFLISLWFLGEPPTSYVGIIGFVLLGAMLKEKNSE